MSFINKLDLETKHFWIESVNETFLKEMGLNTLDKKKFLDYIVQDSIYLRDYLKCFAMALFKCHSLKDMQVFYSVLGFVNDSENATRLAYLKDYNLTDDDVDKMQKRPECRAYTDFLINTSINENIEEILMAVMPCMFGYYEVFKLLKEKYPNVVNTYFGNLANDYSSSLYEECVNYWKNYVDEKCEYLDEKRKEKLRNIYIEGCKQELYFWIMAGK